MTIEFEAGRARAKGNARTVALATIRHKIITLELAPGSRLSESDLADQLGLSRTPVRESLILLGNEQLVSVIPQVGTIVAPILLSQIETAQFVRESIEVAAVHEASLRAKKKDITHLNSILDAQRVADARNSWAAFVALDDEFHSTVMSISGHGSAWRTVARAQAHLERAQQHSPSSTVMSVLIGYHQVITDAMATGNAEVASRAMREHLRGVFAAIVKARESGPERLTVDDIQDA